MTYETNLGIKAFFPQILSVDTLRSVKPSSNNKIVNLIYHTSFGDQGGGTFVWDSASTEPDNNGTIIQVDEFATGRWKRQYSGPINVQWFGAKGDNTTNDTPAIISAITALGDTLKLRSGVIEVPNKSLAVASTIAIVSKSGIMQGAGPGPVSAGGSAFKWTGSAGSPMVQVTKSYAIKIRDLNFTCLDAAIKATAGIDFHVGAAESFSNTNFYAENISIGAMSGENSTAMAPLMIKQPGSTSPDVTILSTLAFPIGLFVWVSTGGTRGTAKVKIATQGYSLDPTSTTWIDASGNPVNFAAAHEFTTAATVNLPAPIAGHTYSFGCATGTYVLNDTYRQDASAAENGVTLTGVNSQNDQFHFRDSVVQGVRDVGIDIQNGQSTTGVITSCKFNNLTTAIQTKSRVLEIVGAFFSSVYQACIRQLNDGDCVLRGFGGEGCNMLAYVDGGSLWLENGYFQPNARFLRTDNDAFIWVNGLDDTNGQVSVRLKHCNFVSDGTLGGRVAKIKISGCKHATVIVEDVGFEGGETVDQFVAHFDMATNLTGQTRLLIFNYQGIWYKKYWNHGDHANIIAANGWQEPLDLLVTAGVGMSCFSSDGNKHLIAKMVTSGPFANFLQLSDTTTPVVIPQDVTAANAGQDLINWRRVVGAPSNDCSIQAGSGSSANLKDPGGNKKVEANATGVGINGQAPAAPPDYTVTNPSTSRSLDVSTATLAELRALVGTMIADLIAIGWYQ